jgi:probable HAF family extracellular repeat protein
LLSRRRPQYFLLDTDFLRSRSYAINDAKQIVGTSLNSSGFWRAFLKAPDSAMNQGFTDLGGGYAYAINNYGDVGGGGTTDAFIWTSASGRKKLIDLVRAGSGWPLCCEHGKRVAKYRVGGRCSQPP